MRAVTRPVAVVLIAMLLMAAQTPLAAMPTPSKTASEQSLEQRRVELAKIQDVVAQPEIVAALAQHGFSRDDVNQRLAQLSPDEIHHLATQVDQLQAAGAQVPTYIWILVAILLGVVIIGAL